MEIRQNDLRQVERHARALMTAHGVGSLEFRFSKGTRQIGALHMRRIRSVNGDINLPHTIALSRRWATVMPYTDLVEIMLHEIAHALTAHASQPHGREFQDAVRRIGGRATRRCFSPSVNIDGTPRG